MEKKYLRVSDHPKYWVSNCGDVYNREFGKYLKPEVVKGGYLRVNLDGEHYYIHKLVADLFIPNDENKKYVVHLDGNVGDNSVNNLAWSNSYKIVK